MYAFAKQASEADKLKRSDRDVEQEEPSYESGAFGSWKNIYILPFPTVLLTFFAMYSTLLLLFHEFFQEFVQKKTLSNFAFFDYREV